MPYSAGVALMYGTIDGKYYEPPYLQDERLLDLVGRVKCIPSDEAERVKDEMNLCDLEVVLKSGQRHSTRVEYHRGHSKNPMTDGEMEQKFRSLASRHLPAARVDALAQRIWALEDLPEAAELVELTRIG